jgi:hypothetical protein
MSWLLRNRLPRQIITGDGYSELMARTCRDAGSAVWSIFFFILRLVGDNLLMNMLFASTMWSLSRTRNPEHPRPRRLPLVILPLPPPPETLPVPAPPPRPVGPGGLLSPSAASVHQPIDGHHGAGPHGAPVPGPLGAAGWGAQPGQAENQPPAAGSATQGFQGWTNVQGYSNGAAAYGAGAVPGYGTGPAPGYGAGPAPGYGAGPGPGYGAGAAPGYGAESAPGYGAGAPPGYGAGSAPGYGAGPAPGYGAGAAPGYGTGAPPGYGAGSAPGYGAGPAPGYGAGPAPGYGAGPAPGYGAGPAPGYGATTGPGLKAAVVSFGMTGGAAAAGSSTLPSSGPVAGATSATKVVSGRKLRRLRKGFADVAGAGVGRGAKAAENAQEVDERMWARAARMAALSDEVRVADVYKTLRRLTARERGEVPWPRLKNGELLAEQLLTKARTLEGEVDELQRLRLRAKARKDEDAEEGMRATQRRVEAKLRGVDRTMVFLTAPDTCWVLSPLHPLRAGCRRLVNSGGFAVFTSLLLLYNCACLALVRRDMPPEQAELIDRSNVSLNLIFAVEMVARIIAMSASIYLRSALNRLDVLLVTIGLADAIISLIGLKVRDPGQAQAAHFPARPVARRAQGSFSNRRNRGRDSIAAARNIVNAHHRDQCP